MKIQNLSITVNHLENYEQGLSSLFMTNFNGIECVIDFVVDYAIFVQKYFW